MTTATIYTIHHTDPDKLASVIAEMRRLGSPAIRAYNAGDHYIALEGTHRIAAAHSLGLPVGIIEMADDDDMDHDCEDVDSHRVGDLIEYITAGNWAMDADAYSVEII